MRGTMGPILARVGAVIGVLVAIGIVLRLIVAILQPVLPRGLMQAVVGGWNLVLGIIAPALPPIFAVGIVVAAWWVITGRRR